MELNGVQHNCWLAFLFNCIMYINANTCNCAGKYSFDDRYKRILWSKRPEMCSLYFISAFLACSLDKRSV